MSSLSFVGSNILLNIFLPGINSFRFIDSVSTSVSLHVLHQVLLQSIVTLIRFSYTVNTVPEAPLVWRQLATEATAGT